MLSLKTCTRSMTMQQYFWDWFVRHEDDLMHFERDRETIFDALAAELQKVHPDLTFEFGPEQCGRREFVISAAGIKKAFPAVELLVNAAPDLRNWTIIAFRPRRPVGNIIEYGEHRVDPKDVQYSLLTSKEEVGLYLYVPGYRDDDPQVGQIGYLFLDEALGEHDVETKVGMIKMFATEAETPGPRYPLKELPTHFDEVYARLNSES